LQLAGGCNVVALSRALGHHSAAFTLSTYVHLLEGDEAPATTYLRLSKGGMDGRLTKALALPS